MESSRQVLSSAIDAGMPVYGVNRGFGPLAEFAADEKADRHGLGLIAHLSAGQGDDLDLETTRLMIELRLAGMRLGYSGISPTRWDELNTLMTSGFVPVVPSLGSVSASGDLIPLAHAARAMSGEGTAWGPCDGVMVKKPAAQWLHDLGIAPIVWQPREALAFVNGSSASLAIALVNQRRIRQQCRVAAALTGLIVNTLGANSEPYADTVCTARGNSPGHHMAAEWISGEITDVRDARTARRLQEPYSLRCAPQVLGSVLDFLEMTDVLLNREASGCSDNPIVSEAGVFHAGNFYAVTAGLASDQHAVLGHQISFMAERQLALILNPVSNGGLPPLLAPVPGATSGLAGVQLTASALLAEIRQMSAPGTTTPVPTNLDNQDMVPMALMSGLRSARLLDRGALILGSLGVGVAQLLHAARARKVTPLGAEILARSAPLQRDRPLAEEVHTMSEFLLHDNSVAHSDVDGRAE
jgi:histidine ammonia-lyase